MIRCSATCSFLVLLALLLTEISAAQPLRWQPKGPHTVPVEGLARDSAGALLASGVYLPRIYKSTDDGATWNRSGDYRIEHLVIGPANEYYALDYVTHRVMRSVDGGRAWYDLEARTDSAEAWIHTLAVSPDGTVYVGTEWFGSPSRSAYTTNGGITWNMSQLPDGEPIAIAGFNPRGDLFKVFGGNDARLRRSTDKGRSWTDVPGMDSVSSSLLLAHDGSLYVIARRRLFRSTDGGDSWSQRSSWEPARPTRLESGPDGALYACGDRLSPAGVFRSTDAGLTWQPVPDAGEIVIGIQATPTAVVVADVTGGFRRSTDGAGTFVPSSSGLGGESCSTVAVFAGDVVVTRTMRGANLRMRDERDRWDTTALDPRMVRDRSGNIYVLSGGRIRRSSDAGASWQYSDSVLPTTAQRLAVGIRGFYAAVVDGNIWRSLDSGRSWEVLDTSFRQSVKGIGFDTSGTVLVSAPSTGMWRFDEVTGKFGTVPGGTAQAGAINSFVTKETGEIFVATMDRGLRRSTDDGRTFVDVAQDLPTRDILRLQINDLGHLVIATESGVYISRNNGDAWESHGPERTLIRDVALDAEGRALIATDEGILVSVEPTSGVEMPRRKESSATLAIAPNPASSVVRLIPRVQLPGRSSVEVFDALGALVIAVSTGDGALWNGGVSIRVDDLASGLYRVRLIAGNHTFTAQLVVAR